jgi:ABC-2 type transport system permease protein
MADLMNMIWVETRKALRSRMPLWTGIGSLFMPLGIAFLLFVARNPEISHKLGLVGAKANLITYAATDWPAYLAACGQMIAAGGFFLFVLAASWIFGREFVDGTLKDLLAVPVARANILLAKYIVLTGWSALLSGVIFLASLGMGALLNLPGVSAEVLLHGTLALLGTSALTVLLAMPFGLFASIGRGYFLPFGLAVLALMMANLAMVLGWGELFPWAVAGLYAQGKSALGPASYASVLITGLVGVVGTMLWWKYADQNK